MHHYYVPGFRSDYANETEFATVFHFSIVKIKCLQLGLSAGLDTHELGSRPSSY